MSDSRFVGGGPGNTQRAACETTGTRACNLSVALVAVVPVAVALAVAVMTTPVAAAPPVAVMASSVALVVMALVDVISFGLTHLRCSAEAFGRCLRYVAVLEGASIVGVKGVVRQRENCLRWLRQREQRGSTVEGGIGFGRTEGQKSPARVRRGANAQDDGRIRNSLI
jgi:hypothetical protein